MEWPSMNAAARRPANYDRRGRVPQIMSFGHEIRDLVERADNEIDELHFADRTQAEIAHAARCADDGAFADGCVNHALPAKPFQQALAGLERPAVDADVFAHQQNRRIVLHLLEHGLPDSLEKSDFLSARCGSACRAAVSASHDYLRPFREAPAAAAFAFFGAFLANNFAEAFRGRP